MLAPRPVEHSGRLRTQIERVIDRWRRTHATDRRRAADRRRTAGCAGGTGNPARSGPTSHRTAAVPEASSAIRTPGAQPVELVGVLGVVAGDGSGSSEPPQVHLAERLVSPAVPSRRGQLGEIGPVGGDRLGATSVRSAGSIGSCRCASIIAMRCGSLAWCDRTGRASSPAAGVSTILRNSAAQFAELGEVRRTPGRRPTARCRRHPARSGPSAASWRGASRPCPARRRARRDGRRSAWRDHRSGAVPGRRVEIDDWRPSRKRLEETARSRCRIADRHADADVGEHRSPRRAAPAPTPASRSTSEPAGSHTKFPCGSGTHHPERRSTRRPPTSARRHDDASTRSRISSSAARLAIAARWPARSPRTARAFGRARRSRSGWPTA